MRDVQGGSEDLESANKNIKFLSNSKHKTITKFHAIEYKTK